MENTSLLARVGVHAQGLVVLPSDVKAFGDAQERWRPIGFARVWVFAWGPFARNFQGCPGHWNTLIIASRGHNHAVAPIFGNDRDPISSQVDGGCGLSHG